MKLPYRLRLLMGRVSKEEKQLHDWNRLTREYQNLIRCLFPDAVPPSERANRK